MGDRAVPVVLWSNLFLKLRGKGGPAEGFGVAISPRTERLVVTGPYRNSRNPMVFGALSIYYSIALSTLAPSLDWWPCCSSRL